MSLLKITDLTLGYESSAVVSNLSFTVDEGDYLCILGENGAGKTTLMKALLGLLKPISGTIERGEGLSKNEFGFLPQQATVRKDFPASVMEIVLSGCQNRLGLRPFYGKAEKEIALKNLRRMGIEDQKDRSFKDLSGGQQQRVLLARALCSSGKILLLDEPVTGLDPIAQQDMYDLVERLNKEGLAIIMITHDSSAAVRYASHILHIGDEVFFGTKDEYTVSSVGQSFLRKGSDA
ncbi:MAG: ABC transporter ATP-binding protein [Clostridiales bacterium]|nr:ABC transporter ATP-binding protein [Clostridiales bacterium]